MKIKNNIKIIKSLNEFHSIYFPNSYEKMKREEIFNDPKKFGDYVAEEILNNLNFNIS